CWLSSFFRRLVFSCCQPFKWFSRSVFFCCRRLFLSSNPTIFCCCVSKIMLQSRHMAFRSLMLGDIPKDPGPVDAQASAGVRNSSSVCEMGKLPSAVTGCVIVSVVLDFLVWGRADDDPSERGANRARDAS